PGEAPLLRLHPTLRPATRAGAPLDGDGLGQTLIEELRWSWRFRRCRARPVPWRRPEPADADWLAGNPWIGRFGDETVAVAAFEGRRW
ncbi:hypothetical protein, partial [Stenotrophomonas maltophilia]|uniref:hypothetical protein n=1 Tax=Stenotrophomonas maltophilia TaxID=40324 RepID=UPI001954B43F